MALLLGWIVLATALVIGLCRAAARPEAMPEPRATVRRRVRGRRLATVPANR